MHEVATVNIQNSQMQGNKISNGSGGSVFGLKIQTFTITKSTFAKGVGYFHGGALYLSEAPEVKLEESNFLENEVTCHSGGAVALFNGVHIFVNSTFFERNAAKRSGGAVYLQQPVQTLIINSHFLSNVARNEDGGGIYFDTSVGNDSVSGYSPSQNGSHTDKRRYLSFENTLTPVKMISTEFKGNEAGRHGGGLYLDKLNGTLALVVNPTFEGCKSRGSGGCAYLASNYPSYSYPNDDCFRYQLFAVGEGASNEQYRTQGRGMLFLE